MINSLKNEASDTQKIDFKIAGKEYSFPLIESANGRETSIDVTDFQKKTGFLLYDSQLKNIALTISHISYSNTQQILYRGYPLADLVEHSSFIEVAYLLTQGELPNMREFEKFSDSLITHSLIHEDMNQIYDSFPVNTNPLGVLATLVTSLSNYMKTETKDTAYRRQENSHADAEIAGKEIDIQVQLLAKIRTLATWAYKKNIGQATVYPRPELPYCANLLYMMFATKAESLEISSHADKLLNQLLILYSEHNANVSTVTVRMLATSGANLFVCINAGISALWGTRDSYVQVMPMMRYMLENKKTAQAMVKEWIKEERKWSLAEISSINEVSSDNSSPHRNWDPRAKIAARLFHSADHQKHFPKLKNDPFFEKALELEHYVLQDSYCQDQGIFPNLDFYSTLLYRRLEIPEIIFNVFRAIGKLAGWQAHWQEQISLSFADAHPVHPIQPNQIYKGPAKKKFVALDER